MRARRRAARSRGPLAVACAVLAACALGFACSKPSSGNCDSICPEGCDVSSDCQSCIPESDIAGLGTSCNGPNDCCVGSCLGGICVASGGGSNGDGGSSSGSAGGSSSGSTGGAHPGCQPWSGNPLPSYDAACNTGTATTEVCGASGTCIPNCNDSAGYCGSEVCEVNGHCKTAGGSSSGTVIGGSSGVSQGSSGTTRGGSSSGARGSTAFGSTGFGSTGFGGSGFGASGFGASSGGFGMCGQTGLASCSKSSETLDCCSEYCVSGVCACNSGGGRYPCVGQNDCCAGAVCTLGICE